MDINREEVFDQLQQFEEKSIDGKIPEVLENYLKYVAKSGDVLYPWANIRPLFKKKIEIVLEEFHEKYPVASDAPQPNISPFNYDEMKMDILKNLDGFSGSPFTIQRICELLTLPTKHYKRIDKYMTALEKNVLVVSCLETRSAQAAAAAAAADAVPTPPKSIFSSEPTYHLFSSNNHSPAGTSGTRNSNNNTNHSSDGYMASTSSASSNSTSNCIVVSASDHHPLNPYSHHSEAGPSGTSSSSNIILPSISLRCPSSPDTSPAPIQQLDSFTTVFSSPPSTPLTVVSNMAPFESASSSSSSSSGSGESSSNDNSPNPHDELQDIPSPPEEPKDHNHHQSSSEDSSSDKPSDNNPSSTGSSSAVENFGALVSGFNDYNMPPAAAANSPAVDTTGSSSCDVSQESNQQPVVTASELPDATPQLDEDMKWTENPVPVEAPIEPVVDVPIAPEVVHPEPQEQQKPMEAEETPVVEPVVVSTEPPVVETLPSGPVESSASSVVENQEMVSSGEEATPDPEVRSLQDLPSTDV